MNNVDNENIDPSKYDNLNEDSTASAPVSGDKISSILANLSSDQVSSNGIFSRSVHGDFKEDEKLIANIEEWYSRALDMAGLNIGDPIQAYGTLFNKNLQTSCLDPQRPGNSYVFFTRPDLNLRDCGTGITPFFDFIMTTEIGNFVAEYLQYPNSVNSKVVLDSKYKTKSPFDPLKTNLCKSVSGLKDIVLDSYETVGDFMGHQLSYATGSDGYDSIGEVTISFEDTLRSPIFLSHYLLIQYIHEVARGKYWPKYEYLSRRIVDYTISIYIFKLAEDNATILRWGKLTGCYPINIPLDTLNHTKEVKIDEMDDVSITYKYNFYEPMEPRIFADFNMLAYPVAIADGDKNMFKEKGEDYFGSLKLINPSCPERLVKSVGSDILGRTENTFGHPIIIGNKLVFI